VTGWVRNLGDGRVEAVFEGDEDAVIEMIQFVQQGPPGAIVTHVEVEYEESAGGFDSFSVCPTR
jgi:acylphosphatase